jgi:diadenosine tetraphosphate (Ap4A) HIT family hydrolase
MFSLHPQLAADTILIGHLPLCEVLLMNDATYPWLILVPRREDVRELFELDEADQKQSQIESLALSTLLMQHFQGDKFNYAALGNMVSQLHLHHIVRFKHDAAWPKPVWGAAPAHAYSEQQAQQIKLELQALIGQQLEGFKPC